MTRLVITIFAIIIYTNVFSQYYTLNGSTVALGNDCYELTHETNDLNGTIWYTNKIDLTKAFDINFKMNFGNKDTNGADGMVFVLQTYGNNALGGVGAFMGYGGFLPSFGIEFDTWANVETWGPEIAADHIAISDSGNVNCDIHSPVQASSTDINIEDGADHVVRIAWNPADNSIKVWFDCVLRIETNYDIINNSFGGITEVYWGFTGSTGGANNTQTVCLEDNIFTAVEDKIICLNDSVILDVAGSDDFYSFSWTPNYNINNTSIKQPKVWPTTDTTYYVTYTDFCGNSKTDSVKVFVDIPTAVVSGGGEICDDGSTTDIILNYTGYPDWEVYWSFNGVGQPYMTSTTTMQTFPSNAPGTVTLDSIIDGKGCHGNVSGSATVIVNPLPTPTITGNLEFCDGLSTILETGTFNSYNWTGGSNAQTLTVTSPGNYSVTVTDINSCSNSDTVTVIMNPLPNANAGLDKEQCLYDSTIINAGASNGGTGVLSYNWNNGLGSGVTHNVSPTISTSYIVTVTDEKNCTQTDTIDVTVLSLPTAIAGIDTEICRGDSILLDAHNSESDNGSIISFLWSTGDNNDTLIAFPFQNTTLTQASVDTSFIVTVTDSKFCVNKDTITITVNQLPNFSDATIVDVNDCANPDGSVTPIGANGHPPYMYNINGGTYSINNIFSPLNSENYLFGIIDDKGCKYSQLYAPGNTSGISITNVTHNNLSCYGDTNSTIAITTSAPTGIVYYSIYGNTNLTTSNTFNNLGSGTYNIFVVDSGSHCINSSIVEITEPSELTIDFVIENVKCFGDSTGSITANYSGGVGGYITTETLTNLVADSVYSFTVEDANGCKDSSTVILSQPLKFEIDTIISTEILCFGDDTASIAVGITGGTLPYYNCQWNTTASDTIIENLVAGVYKVTVTDYNLCKDSATIYLTQPDELTYTFNMQNTICDTANGYAVINPNGGTAPYSYLWSNNSTDSAITNLTAGTYSLTLTDSNNCFTNYTVDILDKSSGNINIIKTDSIKCFGENTGQIIAEISNGNPNYTFTWITNNDTIKTNSDITGIDTLNNIYSGNYILQVTDDENCIVKSDTIKIYQYPELNIYLQKTDILCNNNNNGTVSQITTGGNSPYHYIWSNNQNTENIYYLAEGEYYVQVTDNNDCIVKSDTVNIINPEKMQLELLEQENLSCNNSNNGLLSFNVNGGVGGYKYFLNNNEQNSTYINNLQANKYIFTATDSNNCIVTDTFIITQPELLVISDTVVTSNNNTTIITYSYGGTPEYKYLWNNGSADSILTNVLSGTYTLEVVDKNGCIAYDTILIETPLFIPTVITPNADGFNDTWQIKGIEAYNSIDIYIFNRWGDMLYEFSGSGLEYLQKSVEWDGTWKGKELPLGTYVYILNIDGNTNKYNGTITIVK